MTYSRADLLRLAAEMPAEAVPTMCRVILWICPDLEGPGDPSYGRHQIAILDSLEAMRTDPGLREAIKRMAELEGRPRPDNVVSLFRHKSPDQDPPAA